MKKKSPGIKSNSLIGSFIEIKGAKQNNLKNININIPLHTFNVICGPSGSGKSSLAFETLYAEGQRRYTETLSNYARQYIQEAPKPLLESIKNIPPPLLLGQKNPVRSSRSNVGTHSETLDLLRIIFSKVGKIHCPQHQIPLVKYSPSQGASYIVKNFEKGFLLCPVEKHPKKNQKLLINQLMQDGFSRIAQIKNNKLIIKLVADIKRLPSSSFYIVIDRLVFSDKNRVADSLSQCFTTSLKYNPHLSSGLALLYDSNNKLYHLSDKLMCPVCCYEFTFPITPSLFSFNSPIGACPDCKGFGHTLSVDEEKVIPNPNLTLAEGAVHVLSTPSTSNERRKMRTFCKKKNINMHTPWYKLSKKDIKTLWKGDSSFSIDGFFKMLETKRYKMHVRILLSRYKTQKSCLSCNENRLRSEVLLILFQNKNIAQWSRFTFEEIKTALQSLTLSSTESLLIAEVLTALEKKIKLINRIGLGYLQLNRLVRTLSGGEFQRLNLTGQISGGLSQVLYILDEPTIGLHSKDSEKLIEMLKELLHLGNTVLVVEHDPEVIEQAENIIEMGPSSGFRGGQVIFNGPISSFLKNSTSLTAQVLQKKTSQIVKQKRTVDKKLFKYFLTLKGCHVHNLKNINVKIPLSRFVVCTGVSGSGKSSLIVKTLYSALVSILKNNKKTDGFFYEKDTKASRNQRLKIIKKLKLTSIEGFEKIKKVILIDGSTAEGNQRSSIATYTGIYTAIRNIMATTSTSQKQNFPAGYFSLNVKGGRCVHCLGLGYQEIEMIFMDPIRLTCESCKGLKFQSKLLKVTYRNKNIHDILNLTIKEAMDFFISFPPIFQPLSLLNKVGLDYLCLGQSLSTLSGGESGRLKLTRELSSSQIKETFYIFDEPSCGLHFKEVHLLINVLHKLVDQGASVVVVEHNLQMINESDYIIDLGPEAGEKGGRLVGQGPLVEFIKKNQGASAQCLRKFLNL